jgi:undecaprenyl-diphosphatase
MVALAVGIFVALAVRYSEGSSPGRFDARVTSILDAEDTRSRGLEHLVTLGAPLIVGAMLTLAILALVLRRRRLALLAIVGPVLTGLVTTIAKPLDGRVIDGDSLSFPSGHTAGASALGLVAALLVANLLNLGAPAGIVILLVGAAVPGAAMGVALIVNGWHYPTDTIGGFCVAVSTVLGSALVIERIAERHSRAFTHKP